MKIEETAIRDVKVIVPDVHGDERGYFCETFSVRDMAAAGIRCDFVQDNESYSRRGVVRGLHWQAPPHTQAKLVRVARGAVWDVVVDIRDGSPTFGQYVAEILSARNHRQLFIPEGFAHGFIVLEDDTLFDYKCTAFYNRESERGLKFDDPALGIKWPDGIGDIILSAKDRTLPPLADIEKWRL